MDRLGTAVTVYPTVPLALSLTMSPGLALRMLVVTQVPPLVYGAAWTLLLSAKKSASLQAPPPVQKPLPVVRFRENVFASITVMVKVPLAAVSPVTPLIVTLFPVTMVWL